MKNEAVEFQQPRYTRTYAATPVTLAPDPDRLRKI
jgi:hypothetical protein